MEKERDREGAYELRQIFDPKTSYASFLSMFFEQ